MSRYVRPKEAPDAGTPIWVWIVYALGLLAGTILVLSIGLAAVVAAADDTAYQVNTPALVLWIALLVLAAGTLVWRRRKGGR